MVVPRDEQSFTFYITELANAPYTAARRIESILTKLGYEREEDKDGYVRNWPNSFKRGLISDANEARVDVTGNKFCVWPKFGAQIPSGHINDIVGLFEKEGLSLK